MTKNWTQTKDANFDKNSAIKMNHIAKTVFAPIYPVIARNALDITNITKGVCLDMGSGPGMLAIAVAQEAPELKVVAFDFSGDSRQIATENIMEAGLADRVSTAAGDVHAIPFADEYANLVVSRGSMFFWKDLKSAFKEIYRVLAPGGATYIGGGFGSLALKEQVIAEMLKVDPKWDCYAKKKSDEDGIRRFEKMFTELGCSNYKIIDDETGFWIVLLKSV